ncbi:Shwachman-Bodian-diamond syndrome protein [Lophiostoma macrostomum CBS 122681]|uniref:Shwachman-Bodian-diamond syndrome protein n=1 Tax=Lophiostoma macrostomum CBS 122681 TaxID=1314788 RepID=A0A6A6TN35_9PLEO|nr:Shwachman-Bodian-diamond syndrome protein [Lophiostoma macrostomum CBS 122681]
MVINQPSNQKKLTNTAIVRMRRDKKTFEIVCYPNKVKDWRLGIEKNADNVLQKEGVIFAHVGKGEFASQKDISKAFDGKTPAEAIMFILDKGDFQLGGKERQADQERTRHEVIDIVAGQMVDPKTKRIYTPGMIEKALDQLNSNTAHKKAGKKQPVPGHNGTEIEKDNLPKWRGVISNKPAKSQALWAMKCLIAHQPIPVMRARMKLKVTCATSVLKYTAKIAAKPSEATDATNDPETARKTVKEAILSFFEKSESEELVGDEWELVGFVVPGNLKDINEFLGSQTKGRGRVEILEAAVMHEDD